MKLGLFSWYGYTAPLPHRLKRIRRAGFDTTMLWRGAPEGADSPYNEEVRANTDALGLTIENVHLPFNKANDLWSESSNVRQQYTTSLTQEILCCKNYGIPMIVMHISEGSFREKALPNGIDAMLSVVDYSTKSGVTIAVENTERIDLIEALLDNIDGSNFGLCYDTSHGKLWEPSEFYLLKKYPSRLKCLHISDNDGIEDRHWNIGEGIISWKHFVECFPTDCYCRTLSLEVYPKATMDSEESHLVRIYQSLAKLRDLIESKSS